MSFTPIAIYFYSELNKSTGRDVVVIAQKFQCTICGYIYDPEKGDPDFGASPGMPFEDLPDSWTCPQCGAMKDDFKEVD